MKDIEDRMYLDIELMWAGPGSAEGTPEAWSVCCNGLCITEA